MRKKFPKKDFAEREADLKAHVQSIERVGRLGGPKGPKQKGKKR